MCKFAAMVLCALCMLRVQGAAVYYGGFEDTAGRGGFEQNGDYNDLIFKLTGHNLSLVATEGEQWFDMVAPDENGQPYWDHNSLDGSQMNIGYCLTKTGGCTGLATPAGPNLQYLALAGGNGQPLNYYFKNSGMDGAELLLEVAGLATKNTIGWYDATDLTTFGVIFKGSDAAGATATFKPTKTFGLWASNGADAFFSQTSLGEVDGRQQHLAIFQAVDQNDVVTPEPMSFVMFGTGLLAVGLGLRRKG